MRQGRFCFESESLSLLLLPDIFDFFEAPTGAKICVKVKITPSISSLSAFSEVVSRRVNTSSMPRMLRLLDKDWLVFHASDVLIR